MKLGLLLPNQGVVFGATTVPELLALAGIAEGVDALALFVVAMGADAQQTFDFAYHRIAKKADLFDNMDQGRLVAFVHLAVVPTKTVSGEIGEFN